MVEPLIQSFGGLRLPLNEGDVDTTLTPLDPARDTLAGLFQAAINAELGAVWTKITATLPAGHPLIGTQPVEDVLKMEPSAIVMKQRKAAWPLLCVHRTGSAKFDQKTLNGDVDRLTQEWNVHYVLGPLSVGELYMVSDVCIAAMKVLRSTIRRRGHTAYQDGALQFVPHGYDVVAPLGSVELTGFDGPGQAAFAGDQTTQYYAVTAHLTTEEHTGDNVEAFGDLEAIDLIEAVGDQDEVIPDFIIALGDVPYQQG